MTDHIWTTPHRQHLKRLFNRDENGDYVKTFSAKFTVSQYVMHEYTKPGDDDILADEFRKHAQRCLDDILEQYRQFRNQLELKETPSK